MKKNINFYIDFFVFNLFRLLFLVILIATLKLNFSNLSSFFNDNEKEGIVINITQINNGFEDVSAPISSVYTIKSGDLYYKATENTNEITLGSKVKFRNIKGLEKNRIFNVNGEKYQSIYDSWDILSPFLMILMLMILIKTFRKK